VVAQRSAILGIEHPDTLLSLNNLGAALLRAGKLQEAENVLTGTLDDHHHLFAVEVGFHLRLPCLAPGIRECGATVFLEVPAGKRSNVS
jgi:hypothetical protein